MLFSKDHILSSHKKSLQAGETPGKETVETLWFPNVAARENHLASFTKHRVLTHPEEGPGHRPSEMLLHASNRP